MPEMAVSPKKPQSGFEPLRHVAIIMDGNGRWAAEGRGKRGGVRVIYYFHSDTFPLFLLTVYPKNQQANLTKAERNEFKRLVPILVKTYAKGRKP